MNGLKQLIESLVTEILVEVDTHRRSGDIDFDMSFDEWVSAMGGIPVIAKEYDVDPMGELYSAYSWIEDEIDKDEEGWEEALEERLMEELATDLGNKFYDWQDKWEGLQEEEEPITLFRCVSLASPEDLKMNKLGTHWTDDRSTAKCHWGDLSGKKYIIMAEVGFDDIDQATTMYHNMHPATGVDEQEINLFPGSQVRVVTLYGPKGQKIDVNQVGTV